MNDLKILVFSDSHRSLRAMLDTIEKNIPDTIIHLGDLERDAEEIGYVFPHIPLVSVPGNCDGWTTSIPVRNFSFDGVSILLSHGHLWQVKRGYELAIREARKVGADVLLFGHTHVPHCKQMEDGLWVMNPGASPESYGTIVIENGTAQCFLTRYE